MRIDLFLTKNGYAQSRAKAQTMIEEGLVSINGKTIEKPSFEVDDKETIEVKQHNQYVSRGAQKLLGAINAFKLNFKDLIVLDMGSSTGGFTQIALEHGAQKVIAVDVGKGQLDKSLRENKRVISLEERDIRTLNESEVKGVKIVIGDLSFISLTKILPHVKTLLGNVEMCILFKPQFECGKVLAKKCKGVIKDEKTHVRLLNEFCEYISTLGYFVSGLCPSPIKGGDGNREYLVHLNGHKTPYKVEEVVKANFAK